MRTRFLFMCISVYVCVLAYAGWVMQQPQETWTSMEHAMRMSPVFVGPALAYVIYQFMSMFYGFMMRRTDARILKCQEKSQKILHWLKDTMRFDRTQALLSKYDPEYMLREKEDRMNQVDDVRKAGTVSNRKSSSSLSRRMTAVAASTVGGAGMRLSGALAQLWSVTADTLIADDPVLLNSLRVAESQAQALEEENMALRKKVEQYEQSFGILYSLDDDGDTTDTIPECEEEENKEEKEEEEEEKEEDHSNKKEEEEEKKKKKKAG